MFQATMTMDYAINCQKAIENTIKQDKCTMDLGRQIYLSKRYFWSKMIFEQQNQKNFLKKNNNFFSTSSNYT